MRAEVVAETESEEDVGVTSGVRRQLAECLEDQYLGH